METRDYRDNDVDFSRQVKAGKRTYFFDVKSTRAGDYFMIITESTKRFNDDGTSNFDKHKIFLYKEDFDKFILPMKEVMDFIIREKGSKPIRGHHDDVEKTRISARAMADAIGENAPATLRRNDKI